MKYEVLEKINVFICLLVFWVYVVLGNIKKWYGLFNEVYLFLINKGFESLFNGD